MQESGAFGPDLPPKMARNPRRDQPASWHHVMNRGIAKRTVFETRSDVRYFLSRIAWAVRRGEIEVHAFVVMTTHFHLLARSPAGKMSEALRRIQNEYVRRFNRIRNRDGGLFRGRFRSKPVDSLVHRRFLVRYIDANPVTAGIAQVAHLYPYGSARAYTLEAGPVWLERSWVESVSSATIQSKGYEPRSYALAFGKPLPAGIARLVELRIAGGRWEADPLDDLVRATPKEVLDWMRRKARLADGTRPGVVVCDPASITLAIERVRLTGGCWSIQPGSKLLDGWLHVHAALLRDMGGLSDREIARRIGCGEGHVSRLRARHRALIGEDDYGRRTFAVASEALQLCGVMEM